MGINITQFAPPGTVSKLVWDDDMEPGAGKIFKGDLTGNVTGNVTGDLTGVVRGSLLGYLSRNGVVSASSGRLIVPASSSTGNTPVTINIDWNVTYAIVGNTQKCYIEDPCYIPVVVSALPSWGSYNTFPSATSYTSDGVEIDSISASGNLNIYGAAYITLYGGTYEDNEDTEYNGTVSVADAYIDAGTSLILGDDTPPDGAKVSKLVWDADMVPAAGKKFKGALEGNVTGNLTGKIILNGCQWAIFNGESGDEQDRGLVVIVGSNSVKTIGTEEYNRLIYISYPYLGLIDFRPKAYPGLLTFTVKIEGTTQGEDIGAMLDVYASDRVTLLRSYSKYNDIGTFRFTVDLTDAYMLDIRARGHTDTIVTASINGIRVRLPYFESLVGV